MNSVGEMQQRLTKEVNWREMGFECEGPGQLLDGEVLRVSVRESSIGTSLETRYAKASKGGRVEQPHAKP